MGVVSGPKTRDQLLAMHDDLVRRTICCDSPFEVESACRGIPRSNLRATDRET